MRIWNKRKQRLAEERSRGLNQRQIATTLKFSLGQSVQTSRFKMSEFWGSRVERGDYKLTILCYIP